MKTNVIPMQRALRCSAHSKRTGLPCGSPAVNGWAVCRMHGAGGGAPKGSRNGRYSHGMRTKEAIAQRNEFMELIREARAMMDALE